MPTPDLGPCLSAWDRFRLAREKTFARRLAERMRRKRPGGEAGEAGETVPTDPNRPLDLSGGAAAALNFED